MLDARAVCPVCQGQGAYAFRAEDTFYRVTEYQAALFRCRSCSSLFQWPIPDRKTIATFYPSGYWQESSPGFLARAQKKYIDGMLRLDLMRWFQRMALPAGASVLDIGCSRGDWLAMIRAEGYQVSGIEADSRAADHARKHYDLDVSETDVDEWQPPDAGYDGICFFHLLEHLREPASFLKTCHQALKPDGKILLRVPNIASLQAELLGRRWKGLEIPRHIILFHPQALLDLLDENGFDVTHFSTWSLRDGPPALTSSILPAGEPTWQQIRGRPNPIATLAYLCLNQLATPLEAIAAGFRKGSMVTVVAVRK